MSEAITRGIVVRVQPEFVPGQSSPAERRFLFAYHVRIENRGEETAQLVSRHWIISDGRGAVEEVRGPGVVGEQPVLAPGEVFEYSSFCPLPTPVGMMHGTYRMITAAGEEFDAIIAPFHLAAPGAVN